MEDLDEFTARLFGGRQTAGSNDTAFLSGIAGGVILGLGLSQITASLNTGDQPKLREILAEVEAKANLEDKLAAIKRRIESGNEIDRYGGALMLFSELEKFADALYVKKIRGYYKPDGFKEKLRELEQRKVVSSIDADILCNTIYPKRNLIAHGEYHKVNRNDVIACYSFVSQFMAKYYPQSR